MSQDNIYKSNSSDEDMLMANQNARNTFKFFWRELSWEYRRIVPGLDISDGWLELRKQLAEPQITHSGAIGGGRYCRP